MIGTATLAGAQIAGNEPFALTQAQLSTDSILRQQDLAASYKLEIAWGGNLTQIYNASGNSATASDTAHLAGQPAANAIGPTNVHYNPLTDTDSNWWGAVYAANLSMTIDLLSQQNFNEIQIYLHPLQPTCSAYTIQGSNNNVNWDNLATVVNSPLKNIIAFSSTLNYRYIRFLPNNGGSDGNVRVVAIEIYNWIDESSNIVQMGSAPNQEPNITMETKSDINQSATQTLSEFDAVLDNTTYRYSDFNTNSPIYGVTQPDGKGYIRSGTPVRVTALATAAVNGISSSFSQYFFYGVIQNDDSAAGTQGIILTDTNTVKQAQIICKSLSTRLDNQIDTPAYEGASFDYIFRDLCYRCGIADQNIVTSGLQQVIPWVAVAKQSAQTTIDDILGAQLFTREYELFNQPTAAMAFKNFGRSRADLSITRFISASGAQETFCVPALKRLYFLDGNGNTFYLDQTKSIGNGVTKVSSQLGASNQFQYAVIGNTVYIYRYAVQSIGHVYTYTPSNDVLVDNGILDSAITAGGTMCQYGNFLFFTASISGTWKVYVWDVTKPYSTRVTLGTVPNQPNWISSDGTFLVMSYFASSTSQTLYLYQHNGTPYTTAYSTVTYGPTSTIGKAPPALGPNSTLYFFSSLSGVGSPTMYSLLIAAAYSNPGGTTPTTVGILPVTGIASSIVTNSVFNGTYIYIIFNTGVGSIVLTWDTTKAFSAMFNLGNVNTTNITYGSGSVFGGTNEGKYFDSNGSLWMLNNSTVYSNNANFLAGFHVQGSNTYPTSANYSFSTTDGFTEQVVVTDGNPICNRVQILQAGMQQQGVAQLWAASTAINSSSGPSALIVQPGIKNTFALAVPMSIRGFDTTTGVQNSSQLDGTLRTFIFNPTTKTISFTGPGNLYSCSNTAGLVVGQPVVLLGGTPEIRLITAIVTNTSFTVDGVNSSFNSHNQAVFSSNVGGQIIDSPTLTQNVTISGNSYPITFWGYNGICYLTIDASANLPGFTLSSANIYGVQLSSPTSSIIAIDQSDVTSKQLYKREFLEVINSPFFNDLSFWQDVLLDGKFSKPYLQQLDTSWYPVGNAADVIGITEPAYGLTNSLFETVDVKHAGFKTTFQSKDVLSVFNI